MNCDPTSTRVGSTLRDVVGPELCSSFRRNTEKEMFPGDAVLLEDLPRLPTNSVFFLNLHSWDNSQDGTPVQVNSVISQLFAAPHNVHPLQPKKGTLKILEL